MENMEIRAMQIDDYSQVYALWLSCTGMGLNDFDDSPDGIARFLRRNPETCFVCLVDECLVGAIMIGNDGRRGYIYHTAVSPAYRNRGIGRALVLRGLDALKKLGIPKVALVVFHRNQAGNIFWERLGFTLRQDIAYRNLALREMKRIDT